MNTMLDYEKLVVQHCSPTLAGIKLANMFSCRYKCTDDISHCIVCWNKALNTKGIFVKLLKMTKDYALIYFYRENMLSKELLNESKAEFLREYGYPCKRLDKCLDFLADRLQESEFPHEIGIFLGYPLEDVKAFISHDGNDFMECGCWKVYGDLNSARKKFNLYKKCTKVYCDKFAKGSTLTKLSVVCK